MNQRTIKSLAKVLGVIYGLIALMIVLMLYGFFLNSETYNYRNRIWLLTKESIFQMVTKHQDALERMADEMEEAYEREEKGQLFVNRSTKNKGELKTVYAFQQLYSIRSVWIPASQDGVQEVRVSFAFAPHGYEWGIYYSENGQPRGWKGAGVEKQGDIYVGNKGEYETEHITGNWYFYQNYIYWQH